MGGDLSHESEMEGRKGQIARHQGRLEDALKSFRRAVELKERAVGSNDVRLPILLNSLAVTYDALRDEKSALTTYERSLAIIEATSGKVHPLYAATLDNLAVLHMRYGRPNVARPLAEEALRLREETSPANPHLANSLSTLAGLIEPSDPEKALELYARARSIFEKTVGREHPHVVLMILFSSVVWSRLNRVDLARSALEEVPALLAKVPPENPSWAHLEHARGKLALAERRPHEALRAFQRGLVILEKAYGPDHGDLGYCLVGIGEALLMLGDARAAREPLERTFQLLKNGSLEDRAEVSWLLSKALCSAPEEQERARKLADEALALYRTLGDKAAEAEVQAGRRCARVR
jgi:tetratricopeptide (TPR) repeat protein